MKKCKYISEQDLELIVDMARMSSPGAAAGVTELSAVEASQMLETFRALSKGRITEWHWKQVDLHQIRTYLKNSSKWTLKPHTETHGEFIFEFWIHDEWQAGSVAVLTEDHPNWSPDGVIRQIAHEEQRGQLEVWIRLIEVSSE